ncbi:MAG: 5-dehydro-4-deoxyglucarate dehydratase [Acidobacteria bacterium]|nr:MAG: 5-dehydro-4-deoxyglucarate dehydratase [Acidobacteriota bacterium]
MAMTPRELRSRLLGPIGFPVTPFDARLALDRAALRTNLEAMLLDPPAAIVAAGGTGELYSITPAEHAEIVRVAVEACRGRVPVIAGVGFNTALATELAATAAHLGADGILAFPPYYPNADDAGLFDYYAAIASGTELAMLIYSRDWFHPGPAFVERLVSLPSLVAWKDGQGDVRRLQILMSSLGDRLTWVGGAGDDMVPAYYAAGVRSYTSSVANVAPRLARRVHELASSGDRDLHAVMAEMIVPLYALRARRRGYEVSVMKAMMDEVGLVGGPIRPPLPRLTAEDLAAVRRLAPVFRNWHVSAT